MSGQVVSELISFFCQEESTINNRLEVNKHSKLDKFKILHLNTQSIANKIDELSLLLTEHNVNVVCVSEHWLCKDSIEAVKLLDYLLVSYFCRDKPRGGVAIFANPMAKYRAIDLNKFSISVHAEFCGTEILNSHTVLVALYRSSSGGDISVFNNQLSDLIHYLFYKYKRIILMGDLNVELTKDSESVKTLLNILATYGLTHKIYVPTRISSSSSSCIDNIITNLDDNIIEVGNFDPDISDHHAQFISICDHQQNINNDSCIKQRIITRGGLDTFYNMMSELSWRDLEIERLDSQDMASAMVDILSRNIDTCFPYRASNRERKQGINWFNKSLRSTRNNVRVLKSKALSSNVALDWMNYKAARRDYRRSIKEAKRGAYSEAISNSSNKMKTCWNIINSERVHKSNSVTPLVNCEDFNRFFIDVSNDIINSIQYSNIDHTVYMNKMYKPSSSFFISAILEEDIKSAILKLKDSPALDYYSCNSKLIKTVMYHITYPLSILFNKCVQEGCWPDVFKVSKIVPIHKKGDTSVADNYRPVAIVPVLSKVFEIIIKEKLTYYLESKQLLSNSQYGFRKHRSTITAIANMIDIVVEGLDQGHNSEAVMCDLSKAFDSVSPQILLYKLEYYGIRLKELDLFASYLTERRQYVSCGGNDSTLQRVVNGVPQGSVLGPLLFLIYINDLPSAIDTHCTLFADDTTILTKADPTLAAANFNKANGWFSANKLKLNETKTQTINFSSDMWAVKSSPVKVLGIVLDTHLQWKPHIDLVCSKLASQIFVLRQLKNCLHYTALKSVYYSIINSHLSYGVLFWGSASTADRVFRMQKMAIRVLANVCTRTSCRPLFKQLQILPLPCLYLLETLTFIHRNLSDHRTFTENHNYGTRNADDLIIMRSRIEMSKKNKVDVKIYNALIKRFQERKLKEMNVFIFRKFVKKYLLEYCFYSTQEYFSVTGN